MKADNWRVFAKQMGSYIADMESQLEECSRQINAVLGMDPTQVLWCSITTSPTAASANRPLNSWYTNARHHAQPTHL